MGWSTLIAILEHGPLPLWTGPQPTVAAYAAAVAAGAGRAPPERIVAVTEVEETEPAHRRDPTPGALPRDEAAIHPVWLGPPGGP